MKSSILIKLHLFLGFQILIKEFMNVSALMLMTYQNTYSYPIILIDQSMFSYLIQYKGKLQLLEIYWCRQFQTNCNCLILKCIGIIINAVTAFVIIRNSSTLMAEPDDTHLIS